MVWVESTVVCQGPLRGDAMLSSHKTDNSQPVHYPPVDYSGEWPPIINLKVSRQIDGKKTSIDFTYPGASAAKDFGYKFLFVELYNRSRKIKPVKPPPDLHGNSSSISRLSCYAVSKHSVPPCTNINSCGGEKVFLDEHCFYPLRTRLKQETLENVMRIVHSGQDQLTDAQLNKALACFRNN
ncbi:hypothetical protein DPMN_106155 [Dreissena polymorpha]|uniref:Uncharacterized protein n=1 Tax=Dreissena polymorpha TaxID=45954 RepID=A0A9D4QIG4_DREPO|nr:hypothetical protein DPMN_106155 [Dreissena polymorpha]